MNLKDRLCARVHVVCAKGVWRITHSVMISRNNKFRLKRTETFCSALFFAHPKGKYGAFLSSLAVYREKERYCMISDNLVLVRFVNFIEHYFVVFIVDFVEFLRWFCRGKGICSSSQCSRTRVITPTVTTQREFLDKSKHLCSWSVQTHSRALSQSAVLGDGQFRRVLPPLMGLPVVKSRTSHNPTNGSQQHL